jgi:hypothetical protein
VHRDIKPANVLLTGTGSERARLPRRFRPHARGGLGLGAHRHRTVGRHDRLRRPRAD